MKPLVFLHPLSERLIQLKESVEETAEAENIEIFEVETLEEFNQLSLHLGQFLLMCSAPKVCARMLQLNSRQIKKEESKVILLSSKQYPTKIIDRLSKLGLTEYIMDTVPSKTLQYKVKLQIKSIIVKKEKEIEQIIIKHEEKDRGNEDSLSVEEKDKSKKEKEEDKATEVSNSSELTEDEIIKMQKEVLEEEKSPKSYPGKAALNLYDDSFDEEIILSSSKSPEEEEDTAAARPKTMSDVEKEVEEKKKNLPWHKAKQGSRRAIGTVDKIDEKWSSQSNMSALSKKNEGDLEGQSSTDKLSKERKGQVKKQEKAIETHWEGDVLDYTKEKKDYGEEESLYSTDIKKHYKGQVQETKEINQDFDSRYSNFEEGLDEDFVGHSETDKKDALLKGDSVEELIKQDDLQTATDGTESYDGEMKGAETDNDSVGTNNLMGESKTGKIDNELNAAFEENRDLKDKDSIELTPNANNWKENDLSADSKGEESNSSPMGADSSAQQLEKNLSSSTKASKEIQSNHLKTMTKKKSLFDQNDKGKRKSSLLDKVKANRKNNPQKEKDQYMRSSKVAKPVLKKDRKKAEEREPLIPTDAFEPSDFSADEFENNSGKGDTEIQSLDDFKGDFQPEEVQEGMAGEIEQDQVSLDNMQGEINTDNISPDSEDSFRRPSTLEVDLDEEEAKRKKRLEELYALRKKKLAVIEEKEKKEKETLHAGEDLYKKIKNGEEHTLSMDNLKKHNQVEMAGTADYGKSGQVNLEGAQSKAPKHDMQETLLKRNRHKNEEISIDESSLSELEKELIRNNKDWGEQTIDYKKMREGKEGITVNREASDDSDTEYKTGQREDAQESLKEYSGSFFEGDIEEEKGKEEKHIDIKNEEEGESVIHSDSKGLESIIRILNTYFTRDVKPSDILEKVANLVNSERGFGIPSFFYRSHNSDNYIEILNGYQSYGTTESLEKWSHLKQEKLETWAGLRLPTWSDTTFREEEMLFIYPFYEGVDHLGFAVVSFDSGMKKENATRIEITLEAARAIYLSQRHKENGEEAIYNELKQAPPEEVISFKKAQEAPALAPRHYMEAKDNLILLEKRRQQSKKEKEKEKEKEKPKEPRIKKLWNRMFG